MFRAGRIQEQAMGPVSAGRGGAPGPASALDPVQLPVERRDADAELRGPSSIRESGEVPKRYKLGENDHYDNAITSLAAYARCFVSADEDARDRCRLLNRADLLHCSVRSPDELLAV
jgi:hypothetical protein